LFDEFAERLTRHAAEFRLAVQLASDGDPIEDPTRSWPEEREQIELGIFEIAKPLANSETVQRAIAFDSARLPDGIEPGDPSIEVRSAIYALSQRRRQLAAYRARPAICLRRRCSYPAVMARKAGVAAKGSTMKNTAVSDVSHWMRMVWKAPCTSVLRSGTWHIACAATMLGILAHAGNASSRRPGFSHKVRQGVAHDSSKTAQPVRIVGNAARDCRTSSRP